MAIGAVSDTKASRTTISGAAISGTIKSVSGPSKTGETNKSNETEDSSAETGKGENDPKGDANKVPKTDAEKQAARNAAVLAALGFTNPKDLQKTLTSNPAEVAKNYGLDGNPVAKASSASPDPTTQANAAGAASPAAPGGAFGGGGPGGWSGAGARPGGGYNSGTGGIGGGQPYRPSLADLNARADSIAVAGGARIERIYDPRGGLQEVRIHDANQQVQRELAQLAPLYREVTGRSPTGREVRSDGDHFDIVLRFGEKTQFSQEVASLGQEQQQEARRQEAVAREAENATHSSSETA